MSKLGKTMIAGVIIAIIGLVVLLVALGMNGWKLDNNYEMKNYECTTDINTLQIDFAAGNLKTEYYDGDKIKIDYPESNTYKTSITENAGILNFTTNYKFSFFHFRHLWQTMPETIVRVPKNSVLSLDLKINAGKVDIASGKYGNINLEVNAGTLNFENIECDKYDAKINAGNIKIQNLKTGNSTFKINAGDIKIAKMETFDLSFNINAGNTLINDLTCNSITAKINAGGLNIEKAVSQNINYDINAGSINMNIIGKKEEYNIIVEKDSGSCNLTNQSGTEINKIIKLDIDSGSININFI